VRYVGGKARIAKWIRDHVLAVADEYRGMRLTYVEPFVGSGAVLEQVIRARRFERYIANDIQPDLIRMWYALSREGWQPPEYVEQEIYKELQSSNVPSALRGYAGFACSYGGKFFGGREYRAKRTAPYSSDEWDGSPGGGGQDTERRGVLRAARYFSRVEFKNTDYQNLTIPPGSIIYCDPPYAGTTGYDCGTFDHTRFWYTADTWIQNGAIVFVSEYDGPWPVIDEHPRQSILGRLSKDRRNEKLFMRRP
jgi:DNA adenine methylase